MIVEAVLRSWGWDQVPGLNTFNFLRKCQAVFHSGYAIFHFRLRCMSSPALDILYLSWWVWGDLIVVLMCTPLMTKGHLFKCSSAICTPSWRHSLEKCLLKFFWIGVFVLSLLHGKSSLCILDSRLLLDTWLANIFCHPAGCFFSFFFMSLDV